MGPNPVHRPTERFQGRGIGPMRILEDGVCLRRVRTPVVFLPARAFDRLPCGLVVRPGGLC